MKRFLPKVQAEQVRAPEYRLEVLANGLRVLTVEMLHLHRVEVVALVGVGSRHETPATAGISHFLEHLLFRGTAGHPRGPLLEQAFEALGGSVNAATDTEVTWIQSRFYPAALARGIRLVAGMLRRPLLRDLEIERRVIHAEALEDCNEEGEMISTDQLIAGLLWPDHPLSLPTVGTRESILGIDLEQVREHHRRYYRPGNTVLAVAGRVRHEELVTAAEAAFGDWEEGPVPAAKPWTGESGSGTPSTLWLADPDSQVTLQLAFPVPGRNHPEAVPLRVLRRILSGGPNSRLLQRLREKLGLTYHVDAELELLPECGSLSMELAVAPEQLLQALRELHKVIARLRRTPVSRAELERALQAFRFDLEFSRDHPEELALRYGWGELVGCPRSLAEDLRDFAAVTPERLLETARRWLGPGGLKAVFVGPFRERDRSRAEQLLARFAVD